MPAVAARVAIVALARFLTAARGPRVGFGPRRVQGACVANHAGDGAAIPIRAAAPPLGAGLRRLAAARPGLAPAPPERRR